VLDAEYGKLKTQLEMSARDELRSRMLTDDLRKQLTSAQEDLRYAESHLSFSLFAHTQPNH